MIKSFGLGGWYGAAGGGCNSMISRGMGGWGFFFFFPSLLYIQEWIRAKRGSTFLGRALYMPSQCITNINDNDLGEEP